jgi:hypothetical protein
VRIIRRSGCRTQGTLLRGHTVVALGASVRCGNPTTHLHLKRRKGRAIHRGSRYTLIVTVTDTDKAALVSTKTVRVR